jgi:hypothetical protein
MNTEMPVGSIIAYGGKPEKLPDGWLLCDGKLVNRDDYPELYQALDGAFGVNGTDFYLPDLRGRFLRGVAGESDLDPGRDSRKAMNQGGNEGNKVGSVQGDEASYQRMRVDKIDTSGDKNVTYGTVDLKYDENGWTQHVGSGARAAAGWISMNFHEGPGPKVGEETRPKNAYVHFIIKAK